MLFSIAFLFPSLPLPWLLYCIIKGIPVEVNSAGMACSVLVLFGMLCFVVLSIAGVGLFYYYYEIPARADIAAREVTLKSLRADIAKGQATEARLPEFRAQVDDLLAGRTDPYRAADTLLGSA